ncbi:MAG TPA: hypothetical protein VFE25_05420 [Opitutaceae bacterium]|nr:hypothetical protein [Opitutaceae bacterium]
MKPLHKIALVVGGYVLSVLIAFAAVAAHVATTSGADRQSAGGMFAFGDSILFVLVFGICALVPTGAALFFMRPYGAFWKAISVVALAVAATSIAAGVLFAFGRHSPSPTIVMLSGYSVLRVLLSPLLAMVFVVCAVLSPARGARIALAASSAIEAVVGIVGGLILYIHMP